MKRTIIMLAAVLLLTGEARTVWSWGGPYAVIGTGTISWNILCGEFLSEEKSRSGKGTLFYQNLAWMQGYIIGRNYERGLHGLPARKRKDASEPWIGRGSPIDSIYYAALKYCRTHPMKNVANAMAHVYDNELK